MAEVSSTILPLKGFLVEQNYFFNNAGAFIWHKHSNLSKIYRKLL